MRHKITHQQAKQTGFTLIEVLVTVSIMAVGLLGISAMQMLALRSGQAAMDRGEAALFVTNIAERMRSNTFAVHNGHYELAETLTNTPYRVNGPANSSVWVAQNDIRNWLANINASWAKLDSTGKIACTGTAPTIRACIITISWDVKNNQTRLQRENDTASSDPYSFSNTVIF